jgi:hydroxyacylglutathione hydrolase
VTVALRVIPLELGPFRARSVLLADSETRQALLVDPGFEADQVVAAVNREGLAPVGIVVTHAHIDHAYGVAEVKRAFPAAPVMLHRDDLPLYHGLPEQATAFGLPIPELVVPDRLLEDGDHLGVGDHVLLVRHTPGHSPGHIVLHHDGADGGFVVVGDVLFAGGVGRTDLWGGSFAALERSIREVLYVMPDATVVIPGHGEDTTIGEERLSNPFVSG